MFFIEHYWNYADLNYLLAVKLYTLLKMSVGISYCAFGIGTVVQLMFIIHHYF